MGLIDVAADCDEEAVMAFSALPTLRSPIIWEPPKTIFEMLDDGFSQETDRMPLDFVSDDDLPVEIEKRHGRLRKRKRLRSDDEMDKDDIDDWFGSRKETPSPELTRLLNAVVKTRHALIDAFAKEMVQPLKEKLGPTYPIWITTVSDSSSSVPKPTLTCFI